MGAEMVELKIDDVNLEHAAWLETSNHCTEWRAAVYLFRGLFFVILFIALIGANFYGWNVAGIRHVLLLELDARNHLRPEHFVEV